MIPLCEKQRILQTRENIPAIFKFIAFCSFIFCFPLIIYLECSCFLCFSHFSVFFSLTLPCCKIEKYTEQSQKLKAFSILGSTASCSLLWTERSPAWGVLVTISTLYQETSGYFLGQESYRQTVGSHVPRYY